MDVSSRIHIIAAFQRRVPRVAAVTASGVCRNPRDTGARSNDGMDSTKRRDSRTRTARKPIGLALQGGGSWGAYTWGVLHALLASRSLAIAQLSGTSAGAIN